MLSTDTVTGNIMRTSRPPRRVLKKKPKYPNYDDNHDDDNHCRTILARRRLFSSVIIFSVLLLLVLPQFASILNSSELLPTYQTYDDSPQLAFHQEMVVSVSPNNSSTDEHATSTTTMMTNKPRLVLHAGPPKTGTTSIQCGLIGLNETLASLDNYYYVGKPCGREGNANEMIYMQNLYHHLAVGNPPPDSTVKLLDRHLKLGHNVIISSEVLALLNNEADVILEALLSIFVGFDVTIVVAYRHYHEWLPSIYFQQNYNQKFFARHHVTMPTFEKYMDSHFLSKVDYNNDKTMTMMAHHHPTVKSMLRYSKYCKHVVIFDLHDGHDHKHNNSHGIGGAGGVDLVTNFVCRALPTAEKTCKLLQIRGQQLKNTGNEMDTRQRLSTSLETTILSSFAYSRAQQSPTFSTKIGELQKKWKTSAARTKTIFFKRLKAAVNRLFRDRYFPSSSTGKEDTAAAAGTTVGNSTVNTALAATVVAVGKELKTTVPMACPSVEKLKKLLNMSMASDKFVTSRHEWQDIYYFPKDDADGAGDDEGVSSNNNIDSAKDRLSETRLMRDSYIRERFAKSVAVQKFCSIDLEAIRSDPFWIDFLDSLDPIDLWLEKILK